MPVRQKSRKPRTAREKTATYETFRRATLNPNERKAINAVRTRLHQVLRDDQIRSLILYGSKARGSARRGSDVDLLLIHGDDLTREQKEGIDDLTAGLYSPEGNLTPIHILTYRAHDAAHEAEIGRPLFVNIARDGKLIEGESLMVNETNKHVVSQQFLDSAKERLEAAQMLLDAGHYRDSISRSYYAVLDAADAALIAKGFTPRSHEGSISLFGAHFVKKGLVEKEFGNFFNRIKKARNDADYNRDMKFTKEDTADWFERARDFVETIEKLLPTLLEEK